MGLKGVVIRSSPHAELMRIMMKSCLNRQSRQRALNSASRLIWENGWTGAIFILLLNWNIDGLSATPLDLAQERLEHYFVALITTHHQAMRFVKTVSQLAH